MFHEEILKKYGEGGMDAVLKAHDADPSRDATGKFPAAGFTLDMDVTSYMKLFILQPTLRAFDSRFNLDANRTDKPGRTDGTYLKRGGRAGGC